MIFRIVVGRRVRKRGGLHDLEGCQALRNLSFIAIVYLANVCIVECCINNLEGEMNVKVYIQEVVTIEDHDENREEVTDGSF